MSRFLTIATATLLVFSSVSAKVDSTTVDLSAGEKQLFNDKVQKLRTRFNLSPSKKSAQKNSQPFTKAPTV